MYQYLGLEVYFFRSKFLARPQIEIIHIIDPYGLKKPGLYGITRDYFYKFCPAHVKLVPIHAWSQENFSCPSRSLTKEEKIPWVTRESRLTWDSRQIFGPLVETKLWLFVHGRPPYTWYREVKSNQLGVKLLFLICLPPCQKNNNWVGSH